MSDLAKKIYSEIIGSTKDTVDLNKYCSKKLKDINTKISDLEIAGKLDEIVVKVKYYFNKRIEYCENKGITPEYEFNYYPPNVLFRYSKKYKELPYISLLRKQNKTMKTEINKMSWKSFEHLCAYLLGINGISPIKLTEVNQEGVDFVGIYNIGKDITSIIIPTSYKVKIVGQVKHSSRKIIPEKVRSFTTYCDQIKNREKELVKNLPNWFNASKLPVLGIFMTTSDYTRGVDRFAENKWLILRNGDQIVDNLIKTPLSKEWVKNIKGKLIFDSNSFLNTFKK